MKFKATEVYMAIMKELYSVAEPVSDFPLAGGDKKENHSLPEHRVASISDKHLRASKLTDYWKQHIWTNVLSHKPAGKAQ